MKNGKTAKSNEKRAISKGKMGVSKLCSLLPAHCSLILFLCFANILHAQTEPQFVHRFTWTSDAFALHYQAVIEKEDGDSFRNLLREYTEQTYITVSLQPGVYRFRVIPVDIRGIPGAGTAWRYFRVFTVTTGQVSQLVLQDINGQENVAQPAERTRPRNTFVGLSFEGLGYSRSGFALAGGLTLGHNFNRIGLGVNILYGNDMQESFTFLEATAHFRFYVLRNSRNTGPFVQAEGGFVLIAYDGFDAGSFAPSAGLGLGWRIPLGERFFAEPALRVGYFYMLGVGLTAGVRF